MSEKHYVEFDQMFVLREITTGSGKIDTLGKGFSQSLMSQALTKEDLSDSTGQSKEGDLSIVPQEDKPFDFNIVPPVKLMDI
jgi:hypothetical protein